MSENGDVENNTGEAEEEKETCYDDIRKNLTEESTTETKQHNHVEVGDKVICPDCGKLMTRKTLK